MYYSTHLIVGATLGAVTGHPAKALIAGLASHILLDLIPHHDHEKVLPCVVDVVGSTALFAIWYLYYDPGISLLMGAIAGAIPDVEIPLYYFRLIKKRYFPSHSGWTPHSLSGSVSGKCVQALIIIIGIWSLS